MESVTYVMQRVCMYCTYGPNILYPHFRVTILASIHCKYSTLPRGISIHIAPKVEIFPEAEGRVKYSLPRVQYVPIYIEYLFYYIG